MYAVENLCNPSYKDKNSVCKLASVINTVYTITTFDRNYFLQPNLYEIILHKLFIKYIILPD